jgi:hypothetical protein
MLIPSDEIVSKRSVGRLGSKSLWEIGTIGGLWLIESRSSDGSKQVVGAGSHRAVARMTARKLQPDIEWTMLEKSQEIDPRDVEDILPFWLSVVERAQQKLG